MGIAVGRAPQGGLRRALDLSTFVTVGNALQSFARLLEGVGRIAARLPQPVIIQHGHTPTLECQCQFVAFLSMDDFIRQLDNAQVLIMHAGAGSLIHAIRAGKTPVVMPRRAVFGEHVNDHQMELARALSEAGRVVVAHDPEDLMQAVEAALAWQMQEQKHHTRENAVPALVSAVGRVLSEYAGRTSV